jgi:hypothetical protein
MKAQKLFDKAVAGLAKQEWEQSTNYIGDACAYRGKGGKKCAVGHVLADSYYRKDMDDRGRNLESLLLNYKNLPLFIREHIGLLDRMQTMHDENQCPLSMKAAFKRIAEERYLQFNDPTDKTLHLLITED